MMMTARVGAVALLLALILSGTVTRPESDDDARQTVQAFARELRVWSIPRQIDFKTAVGIDTFEGMIVESRLPLALRSRDRTVIARTQDLLANAMAGTTSDRRMPIHVLMKVELVGADLDHATRVFYVDSEGAVWHDGRGSRAQSGPGFYEEFWNLITTTFR